jgi:transcriptional regulator NrdR family protein
MMCPVCSSKMGCNQTRNYTDSNRGFMYVERRRVCSSCGYRMMTVEVDQDIFTGIINESGKEEVHTDD